MAIDIASATLVSIFVESVLYGFLVFLFAVSTTIIVGRHRRQGRSGDRMNKTLLTVSVTMFILATIVHIHNLSRHIGSDLWRLLDAFITHKNSPHGGTAGALANVSTAVYLVKSTAYCMQTLVGDGFMIYRLYLVWNGNRLVCFPMTLTFIASVGVGIGTLQCFSRVSSDAPVFGAQLHNWIATFFALTLFTNFASTALIAGRIWWVQHQITGMVPGGKGRGSLAPAAIVIIESGAIYSACLILLLSLYLSGTYAQYILLDAVQQVVGIVFSLVIVRVALGVSSEVSPAQTTISNRHDRISFSHTTSTTSNFSTWQSNATNHELRDSNFEGVKVIKSTRSDAMNDPEGEFDL